MFTFIILPRLVFLLVLVVGLGAIFLTLRRFKQRRILLSIYAALLALLLADAVFYHRSIPGHLLRWVEGEQGMNQVANDYLEDSQKTIDPLELQRWAESMIKQSPYTGSPSIIPLSQVPANIQNFKKEFPLKDHLVLDGVVYLGWGGGLGHLGFYVGPPTFKTAPPNPDDNNYGDYVEWKPGIYFWAGE